MLKELSGDDLEDMIEALTDLRHDLAKYMVFELRFVDGDAPTPTLRAALEADLLATRRRGDQTESAWALWERLRPDALGGEPEVRALDRDFAALAQADLAGDRAALDQVADRARAASARIRGLHKRAVEQRSNP